VKKKKMNNKKIFLRAAIMVGLMFAVLLMAMSSVQASPGAVTVFEDDVENVTLSLGKWTNTTLWHITTPDGCNCTDNNSWYYGQEGDCDYNTGATNSGTLTSKQIELTGALTATLTFWTYWETENTGTFWDKKLVQVSTDGGANWTTVKQLSGTENGKTISVNLTGYAGETIKIQFYFDTVDHLYNNYYGWCIDDIKVVKEGLQMPSIEVNKTVWDPETKEWVDEITANISDILRFNCTIHNDGIYNLSDIVFWDILDCSLEYADNATLDGEPINLDDDEFIFKPKTLEPDNPSWNPSNPYGVFWELCPEEGNYYELEYWEDTNDDGRLSECDQIIMGLGMMALDMGVVNEVEYHPYHVDKVPYSLWVGNDTTGKEMCIDSELDYEEINLSEPVCTDWNEVCCCKDSFYHLQNWSDVSGDGNLSEGDIIELRNKRTGEVAEYFVDWVAIDLVVSREWWIDDLMGEYIELEPCQKTITIEFDARVVKCGVDNNTQFAKGWCDDTEEWVYDNDTVTINVPAKPDLVITKNATYSDGNLTVNYTVSNCGPCACTDANESWVGIYINETLNKTVSVPSLPKCNSSTNEVVIEGVECPCGTTLNVTVCADYNNSVVECNETNNCEVNEVECPLGDPDLKITDKFETWLNMTHYNITYTVTNIGSVNATNVSRTNITIDGPPPVENDTVEPLNASETHTATFGPYEMSGDNDTIRICADIDNNVSEYNEDNNCLQNTLHKSTTIEVNTTGWWVKPVNGDSAEGEFHSSPNTPIQDAIDNATDGCTILVHDGTYNENVVVDKELTIKAASSPIIDGLYSLTNPAIHITAANVIVQGFIIQNFICTGADCSSDTGAILVEGDGAKILDNLIRNINCTGTESCGPAPEYICPCGMGIDVTANNVTVTNNTIYNISSQGIRVRARFGQPAIQMKDVLVRNNTVNDTGNSGIIVVGNVENITIRRNEINGSLGPTPYSLLIAKGPDAGVAPSDVTIENNTIYDGYGNIAIVGASNITISGNTITGAIPHYSDPNTIKGKNIYILDDCWWGTNNLSTNISITNNDITNAEGYGVMIKYTGGGDASAMATTTTINYNNIVNNTVYGVENTITTADVNATHNWWNDTCGPGPVGPGSGDNVTANVTYSPWLDAPYPVGEPVGDLQSGQINLTYNQTCANVTNWTRNDTNFGFGGWTHKNGSDRISFARNNSQTGEYLIGTLTIHCVNSSEKGCNTTLNFDNGSELFDDYGKTLPVEWINGTFNCTGILCGDVNCNGEVNVGDATLILNHWTDSGEYPLCNNWAGDVNCDFAVNVGDATLILNHWLNPPGAYPLNCCSI
jgi:hypothetical protein